MKPNAGPSARMAARFFLSFLGIAGAVASLPVQASPPAAGAPAISVTVDAATGRYVLRREGTAWTLAGSAGGPVHDIRTRQGDDDIGHYVETAFAWSRGGRYTATIRSYVGSPMALFSIKAIDGGNGAALKFPDFTRMPAAMHTYSFRDDVFSPPAFGQLTQTSTPWLFFDDRDQAYVVSPANQFIVSKMTGDGAHEIAVGLNPEVARVPRGFEHKAILVAGQGIAATWQRWGRALVAMYKKQVPANDADTILKYYGYWTDNFADYYYNYEPDKGYANTLLDIPGRYRREGIRLGYMQLDSWWYRKSIYDVEGRPVADHKNPKLPLGSWNRYGGLIEYRPDPFVFPDGVASFRGKLGLPLVTHNRWIDPHSPYHQRYEVDGFAAVGRRFWNDMADYLTRSGIVDYEQDWLNFIYSKTPSMAGDLSVGNDFADNMAAAMAARGIDMQYCMAPPRFFLQGVKYRNLTTIRTSPDGFAPSRWRDFLYASQFAHALGIWPWSDVFKSRETGNMILSVLSAGPVGTGDAIGREDMDNILKAARPDGVIVKPDAPLVPLDSDYINEARHADVPMLAATYTRHGDLKTSYVFAFAPGKTTARRFSIDPAALGQKGAVIVYDPATGAAGELAPGETFTGDLGAGQYAYAYYVVAPVNANGIALVGDAGKIASTGKARIARIETTPDALSVTVAFAAGERPVTLIGHYETPIAADRGTLALDPRTRMFKLTLPAPSGGGEETVTLHRN